MTAASGRSAPEPAMGLLPTAAGPRDLAPVLVALAVVAGAVAGTRRGPGPATELVVAGLGSALAAIGAVAAGRVRAARVLATLLAGALLGTASMQRALDGLERSPLADPIAHGADVELRATVVDDPTGGPWSTRVVVRVDRWRPAWAVDPTWRAGGGRHVAARAAGADAGRLRVLLAGDRVVLAGTLDPLDEHERWLRWRHVVGALRRAEITGFAPASSPLLALANGARDRVLAGSRSVPPDDRALLAGFLLGDTRDVPREVVGHFRDSGLTHLLAVSGANVAFTLALVGPLLRRLPTGPRVAAGLGVLLVFAAMTRFQPSVLRASAMAACALAATFVGRPVSSLRLLAFAVLGLVLVDPFLVRSVGFQLSCGASAGIVLWARPVSRRLPGPAWLRDPFSVTLAAQAGVTPALLGAFGSVPLASIPANLVGVPVNEPLTVYGIVAGAAGGLVADRVPVLAAVAHLPVELGLLWIRAVARVGAALPGTVDPAGAAGLVALGAAVLALGRVRATLRRG